MSAISLAQARSRLDQVDRTTTQGHQQDALVRDLAQRVQTTIHETGETIRELDDLIISLRNAELDEPERDELLTRAQDLRRTFYEHMQLLNPEQAWFWTEEWQAGEREVDANIAAGRLVKR